MAITPRHRDKMNDQQHQPSRSASPCSTPPQRIQRRRTKGWQMPENTVCVTRPGRFGNPFDNARRFREVLEVLLGGGEYRDCRCRTPEYLDMKVIAERIDELRGKNLACFCPPGRECHADVLIEYANR